MPQLLHVLGKIFFEAPRDRWNLRLLQLYQKESVFTVSVSDAYIGSQLLVEYLNFLLLIDVHLLLDTFLKDIVNK